MKQIRYGLEALFINILFTIFRILPMDAASAFGGFLGRRVGVRLAASRKARRNIELALPNEDSNKVLADMWENLGRVMAEYPHLERIARERVTITGSEHAEKAAQSGKGAVFMAAHFGNWEVIAASIFTHFYDDVHVTYRAPNNPVSDKILSKARTLKGKIHAHTKSRSGGRAMMKALKDGAFLGIMIDQKYNQGVKADFFGRPAMTNPIFAQLPRKYDVPLIPVYCRRTQGVHFELVFEKPMTLGEDDLTTIAKAHERLETWIKASPGQWLWLHRRWKD